MKNKAAAALGHKGGMARAAKLTPKRRTEIAKMGGKARQNKEKENEKK